MASSGSMEGDAPSQRGPAYAAVLAVFFDVKASREERWLSAAFPDYTSYQARVRKLIPFVY